MKMLQKERNVKIVNVTPHPIHLKLEDGVELTFAPEKVPARCAETHQHLRTLDLEEGASVTVARKSFGKIENLPKPQKGVVYVASMLVAQAAKHAGREDVVSPDGILRDDEGQIVGCTGFCIP